MTLLGLLLTFVAVAVLPGMAGGLLLTAGRRSDPHGGGLRDDRFVDGALIARCLAVGTTVWLLTAGLLVRTTGVTAASTDVAAVVLAVASVLVLLLPGPRRVLRSTVPAARYAAAAAGLALTAWAPVGVLMWRTSEGTVASTPWYYWGLARQLLETGKFPETSVEFATTVPYLADYPLYTAGTAMLMSGLPESAQPAALNLITVVAVVTLGSGAALLAWAWGASRGMALLAAPLAVSFGVGLLRLLGSRPEGFALGLSLLVVVLVVDWFRHRDVVSLGVAAALAAVVSQVHGIAFLVMGLLLVAAAMTVLLEERSWRFVLTAVGSALTVLGAVGLLALAMGRLSGASTAGGIVDASGDDDLTWTFRQLVRAREPDAPPTRMELLWRGLDRLYADLSLVALGLVVLAVVVLVVRAVAARRVGARAQAATAVRHLAFFGFSAVLLVSAAAVFLLGWDSYVPRRTGTERVLMEATLLPGVLLAGAAAVGVSALQGQRRRLVTVAAVGLTLLAGTVGSLLRAQQAASWRPDPQDRAALASLDLPEEAVILGNAYTEGYLGQVTGARPLLEGRAPYTFPDQLERAVGLLEGAGEFFDDPGAHLDYLDRHDVDYLVVARPDTFAITNEYLYDDGTGLTRLRTVPQLEEVLSSEGLVVFRYAPRDPDR